MRFYFVWRYFINHCSDYTLHTGFAFFFRKHLDTEASPRWIPRRKFIASIMFMQGSFTLVVMRCALWIRYEFAQCAAESKMFLCGRTMSGCDVWLVLEHRHSQDPCFCIIICHVQWCRQKSLYLIGHHYHVRTCDCGPCSNAEYAASNISIDRMRCINNLLNPKTSDCIIQLDCYSHFCWHSHSHSLHRLHRPGYIKGFTFHTHYIRFRIDELSVYHPKAQTHPNRNWKIFYRLDLQRNRHGTAEMCIEGEVQRKKNSFIPHIFFQRKASHLFVVLGCAPTLCVEQWIHIFGLC